MGRGRGMGGMGSFRAVMQDGSARAAGIYSSHQLLRQAFDLSYSCYARYLFFKPAVTPGIRPNLMWPQKPALLIHAKAMIRIIILHPC